MANQNNLVRTQYGLGMVPAFLWKSAFLKYTSHLLLQIVQDIQRQQVSVYVIGSLLGWRAMDSS